MSDYLITIVHPTARVKPTPAFPEGWREAARVWFERAADPSQIQYLLACHESRWDDLLTTDWITHFKGDIGAWEVASSDGVPQFELVQNTARDCSVDQVNACLPRVKGKLIVISQDDMFPPQDWDIAILDRLDYFTEDGKRYSIDDEHVLHVSSASPTGELPDRNDTLFNPQILTTARAKRLGYIGYPGYVSPFSDDEFSEHARLDGCVIDARHIVFEHRHPMFGGKLDSIYQNENSIDGYQVGLEVLLRRRAGGFSDKVAVETPTRPKLIVCLPGESFSSRWVSAWDGLRCFLPALFDVQPLWATSGNVYVVRNAQARQALESGADYILWLDHDNVLHLDQFLMLYEDLRSHEGIGLVACWCWTQSAPDGFISVKRHVSAGYWDQNGNCVRIEHERMMQGDGDLIELDWTGFPCVLMPRATLEKLGKNPFTALLSDAHEFGMSGEDTAFCRRVQQAGLKVVLDRRLKVPHLKLTELDPPEVEPAKVPLVKRAAKKVLELMGA